VKGRINRKRRKSSLSPICRQTTYDPNALGSLRLKGLSLRIRPPPNSLLVRGNFNYLGVMLTWRVRAAALSAQYSQGRTEYQWVRLGGSLRRASR
jgi:hypothetical protein